VSRCQRIPFRRLDREAIAQVLAQTGNGEILQHPEVMALAQGSPGEAIAQWQQIQAIPPELLEAVTQPPKSLRNALDLARQVAQALDIESQLWLLDYLQYHYWETQRQPAHLHHLEKARRYLLQYVQPRLVWEVTFLGMKSENDHF
jgi:DNA polymerase III subunit delta'